MINRANDGGTQMDEAEVGHPIPVVARSTVLASVV